MWAPWKWKSNKATTKDQGGSGIWDFCSFCDVLFVPHLTHNYLIYIMKDYTGFWRISWFAQIYVQDKNTLIFSFEDLLKSRNK